MISKPFETHFKQPNFKCTVLDRNQKRHTWITYAESAEALMLRLEKSEYEVTEIIDYTFNDWKEKAATETQNAISTIERGESVTFQPSIWSELKLYLFELFDGKCAYCESKVLHISSGDVEHYRPKKSPREDLNHPGYYWLAYNERNLLPSCEKCNRTGGKKSQFPVRDKRACSHTEDLLIEERLLLNPYEDKPDEHLLFPAGKDGICIGTIKSTSEIGEKTIDVCNLDRRGLNEQRKAAQETAISKFSLLLIGDSNEARKQYIEEIKEGRAEYSQAVLSQIKAWVEERTLHIYSV